MDNNLQKELFVATLMHDLKNPVLAQISALSQLSNGSFGELNNLQKEIVDMTLESCQYVQKLIFTLLETYKNENGKINLKKNYFNPENFIKICLREQQPLIKEKNLDFVFESNLNEEENILFADETQLRRVVENILNNQIFYAFKNTKLSIKLFKKNNNIVFYFENSSPEIDEKTQKEIFEKFKTKEIANQKLSLGLGLYLAKQITEAHSGKIYLKANGTSNKFIVEIPTQNTEKKNVMW